ncbi:non-ribosomal peptide synthetase [Pelagibaculum spongiae]|uniref:Carrier domain-containing protein n=1 Tax=Pelagibaculum spongiae TaxID=2080658 RepID=A0A2V1GZY4_9GAMM|nr:D-alanine--poly(phosphoribitol) ligase subunit DltA [Pelagibaculum spongiae]PVZ68901.1 hypothetical protein DC094_11655 [Pelagibaculum spongiae]
MTIKNLITELAKRDIQLRLEQGRLAFSAPEGAFTAELKQQVSANKAKVVAFLEQAARLKTQTIATIPGSRAQLPLSFAQERLWFIDQLEGGTASYNMAALYRLTGSLNLAALDQAFFQISQRHEVLRSRFNGGDGQPYICADLDGLHLNRLIEITEITQVTASAKVLANQPFQLTDGPLVIAQPYRLAADDHQLLICMHHIISDGWSVSCLINELSEFYAAAVEKRQPKLPPLALQYADFAAWQRNKLTGVQLEKQTAFWLDKLAGSEPLALASDFKRSPGKPSAGITSKLLCKNTVGRLSAIGNSQQTTQFMNLMAIWSLQLSRLANQQKIVIGAPVAGRDRNELQPLIGLFLNTLAFASEIDWTQSFRSWLGQTRATILDAWQHQDIPFEKIVETLQPERDITRTPVFQVFLNMLNLPKSEGGLAGLQIEQLSLGDSAEQAKFDLTLYASETEQGIKLDLLYRKDLFKQQTAEYWLNQLVEYSQLLIAAPDTPLSEIALPIPATGNLAKSAREQAFLAPAEPKQFKAPLQLLSEQIQQNPLAIAVSSPDLQMNYQQLSERVFSVYRQIQTTASTLSIVGHDSANISGLTVAVLAERNTDLVVNLLAAFACGGSVMVLDSAWPAERLKKQLSLANVDVVLAAEMSSTALPTELDLNNTCYLLKCAANPIDFADANDFWSDLSSYKQFETARWITFSSGTTGQPKGMVSQLQAFSAFADWYLPQVNSSLQFNISQSNGNLSSSNSAQSINSPLLAGLSHDPLLRDLFMPLISGGCLHIPSDQLRKDGVALAQWIDEKQISLLHLTPALAQLMLFSNLPNIAALASVKMAVFGGDKLSPSLLPQLKQLLPSASCFNGYGLSETPQLVTLYPIDLEADATSNSSLPIGKLSQFNPCYQFELFDLTSNHPINPTHLAGNSLVGSNQLGELVVRSHWLSSGLSKGLDKDQPQLSETTILKTGDLAVVTSQGEVCYQQRKDQQVKLRGYRIELEDVRFALREAGFANSWVDVCSLSASASGTDSEDNQALVAWIKASDIELIGQQDQSSQLPSLIASDAAKAIKQQLAEKLPAFMLPTFWIALENIPLNANGKIDRHALPRPDQIKSENLTEQQLPQGDFEVGLAEIWSELLSVKTIAREDDFFSLGGHSLMAMRLIAQIRHQFSIELPLKQIFTSPDLQAMAARIEQLQEGGAGGDSESGQISLPPLLKIEQRPELLPLTSSQKRLWFIQQLEPTDTRYNLQFAIRIKGSLDTKKLANCFDQLVQRHVLLHSCFPQKKGEPYIQLLAREHLPQLQMIDQSLTTEGHSLDQAMAMAYQMAAKPYNLLSDSSIRSQLVSLNQQQNDYLLLLGMHHIVGDAWSTRVLFSELFSLYQNQSLPELEIDFVDFSLWQQQHGELANHQVNWWVEQLSGVENLQLPYRANADTNADTRQPQTEKGIGHYRFSIDAVQSQKLKSLLTQQKTTLFTGLFSLWSWLLSRYSYQNDFAIGTPVAGRDHLQLHQQIGFFVNTLVLRADLSKDLSFNQLLQQSQQLCLDAWEHAQAPLDQVIEQLDLPRDLKKQPLFQTMLVLQNRQSANQLSGLSELADSGLQIEPCQLDLERSASELQLNVIEHDQLEFDLVWQKNLFDEPLIHRMAKNLQLLIDQVLLSPNSVMSKLSWPMLEERLPLKGKSLNIPTQQSPVQLLQQLAQQHGQQIAVICADQQISFEQLHQQSLNLALHLQNAGVTNKDLVAFYLPRSINQIVAMAAIWQLGAGWLPMDPDYPSQRSNQILKISQAKVLLDCNQTPYSSDLNLTLKAINLDRLQLTEPVPENLKLEAFNAQSPAYLIFTSGSSGEPKGVRISHAAVNHLQYALADQIDQLPIEQGMLGHRVAVNASVAFDGAIKQLIQLYRGATLVLLDQQMRLDPPVMLAYLNRHHVSRLDVTPSQLTALLDARAESVNHLPKTLLVGGETINNMLWQTIVSLKDVTAFNVYGPTEATVDATCQPIVGTTPSLGQPLANLQLSIVDQFKRPAPAGAKGQLLIAGPQLAIDYLNQPQLTAEKFINFPQGDETDQQKTYLTGDGVRQLLSADGSASLQYIERLDRQIKIRGFRIEPGEIQQSIRAQAGVSDAVVVVRIDPKTQQPQLIAWIVADLDADSLALDKPFDFMALEQQLAQQLPEYMIPRLWSVVAQWPTNRSGKIDISQLKTPEFDPKDQAEQAAVVQTQLEKQVAEIWQQLLKLDYLPANQQNFFSLGGHSLLATRLVSAVKDQFNRTLPIKQIFETPLLTDFCRALDTQINRPTDSTANAHFLELPIEAKSKDMHVIPLSFSQQRIWFVDQMLQQDYLLGQGSPADPTSIIDQDLTATQNLPLDQRSLQPIGSNSIEQQLAGQHSIEQRQKKSGQELPGGMGKKFSGGLNLSGVLQLESGLETLDIARLQQAFVSLLTRHQVLSGSFIHNLQQSSPSDQSQQNSPANDGSEQQNQLAFQAKDPSDFVLHQQDFTGYAEQAGAIAETRIQQFLTEGFDLANGPLLAAKLFKIDATSWLLAVKIHHIAADGWSVRLVMNELARLYLNLPLESLPIQYADYALWQQQWLQSTQAKQQLDWWKRQLQDLTPINLYHDPEPQFSQMALEQLNAVGQQVEFALNQDLSQSINGLSAKFNASPFMVFVSLWQLQLSRWSGQQDICLGTPVAGRNQPQLESLIGLFLNNLVLRSHIDPEASFADLLSAVRSQTLDAYTHQDLPFEQIIEALDLPRDPDQSPIFQCFINMLNLPDFSTTENQQALQIKPWAAAEQLPPQPKFDIELYIQPQQDQSYLLRLVYRGDKFSRQRMQWMLQQLEGFAQSVVNSAQQPVKQICAIEQAAEFTPAQLLKLNSPQAAHPLLKIYRHAAHWPQAIAIIEQSASQPSEISYQQLINQIENQAQAYLQQGISAGDCVALLVERNVSLVVNLLALARVGAVHLLLDSQWPVARIEQVLQQAKPVLLVDLSEKDFALPRTHQNHQSYQTLTAKQLSDALQSAQIEKKPLPVIDQQLLQQGGWITFTSGTTGKPQGICSSMQPLADFLLLWQQQIKIEQIDRVSMLSGLGHDPLLRDIWLPLTCGATLMIPNKVDIRDQKQLENWLSQTGVTVAHITPAMSQILANCDAILPTLRCICFGGDKLRQHHIQTIKQLAPAAAIFNGYGASETPQLMVVANVTDLKTQQLPIGIPLSDVLVQLERSDGQPAEPFETGEIHLISNRLAKGYLGSETGGFYQKQQLAAYKTGDIGWQDSQGQLHYLRRKDQQVSIRGYRVEPVEIALAVKQLEGVLDAYVIAWPNKDDDPLLAAYVVTEQKPADESAAFSAAKAALAKVLPQYMVPNAFVLLETIPLNANGKVDLAQLTRPEKKFIQTTEYQAPQSALEIALAEIWQGLLGIEKVGIYDNFFDLGGHSLLVTQMLLRLKQHNGVDLPLRAVFEMPTIAGLAELASAMVNINNNQQNAALDVTDQFDSGDLEDEEEEFL